MGNAGVQAPDAALAAESVDGTAREILGELLRMGTRERRLLLSIAREISGPGRDR